jgi:hypothetical protein
MPGEVGQDVGIWCAMTDSRSDYANESNPYRAPQTKPGARSAADEGLQSGWRDGPYLVLRKRTGGLPDRCIVCGGPTEGAAIDLTLREIPLGVAGLLVFLFFWPYFLFARTARLSLDFCSPHRNQELRARNIWRGLFLPGILLFLSFALLGPILVTQEPIWENGLGALAVAFLGGTILVNVAVCYAMFRPRLVHVRNISQHFIWLAKVPPDYLAQFPDLAEDK